MKEQRLHLTVLRYQPQFLYWCVCHRVQSQGDSFHLLSLHQQKILALVNKQVKYSNEQRKLMELQAKIECVGMDKTQHPIAKLYKVS